MLLYKLFCLTESGYSVLSKQDAIEQYGRRNCLRITCVSDTEDDTTTAVVNLANDVLNVQPPLTEQGINSHRLPKPRTPQITNHALYS